ncbi:MAG TPA: metallophosphoesterase, partial [Patescibacteria group bacterium]|nr:metallophosphoesterase [Patescibacteria group bacterium]
MKALLLIMFLTLSGCNWTIKRITEASTDGPYVFYRDGKLIVKSLRKSNDEINVRVDTFLNRSTANLMCYVDESTDSFPILLKDTLLTEPSRYDLPERIFAISDIEGNYKAFKNILVGAGVIDTQNNWTFKDGHVVLVGDFFDRGTSVTETLWLIYKLEGEAEKAGGKVHFILGNHEMMNMYGNLKYLEDKYLKNAKLIDEKYKDFYWTESELGRWLRTKNIAEQIGTILFVHGG